MRKFLSIMLLCSATNALAAGQFIDVAPKNADEVKLMLDTLASTVTVANPDTPPIIVMLHGDTARHFVRANYDQNKNLVDQTAALAAFNVINVQICSAWLEMNDYATKDLFPFINPVPYGADELTRLSEEDGYTEYSVDL